MYNDFVLIGPDFDPGKVRGSHSIINALKSINLASGKFAWFLGDDDLLLPKTLQYLKKIFEENSSVEYFFINSYHLDVASLDDFSHPFDTANWCLSHESYTAFVFFLSNDFGSISVTNKSVSKSLSKSAESAPIDPRDIDLKYFEEFSENVLSLLFMYK